MLLFFMIIYCNVKNNSLINLWKQTIILWILFRSFFYIKHWYSNKKIHYLLHSLINLWKLELLIYILSTNYLLCRVKCFTLDGADAIYIINVILYDANYMILVIRIIHNKRNRHFKPLKTLHQYFYEKVNIFINIYWHYVTTNI